MALKRSLYTFKKLYGPTLLRLRRQLHQAASRSNGGRSASDKGHQLSLEKDSEYRRHYLHNLDANDAALVEHEALAHDGVAARVLAVLLCGLGVPVVHTEDARPLRPGIVVCPRLRGLVHQLQIDHLRRGALIAEINVHKLRSV